MREPAAIQDMLERATASLDAVSKAIADAHDDLTRAEEAWDKVYDDTFEQLKDTMVEEERKGDPAAHVVESVARRIHRDEYRAWRAAKREVAKLETISSNRRSELSGYQSEVKLAQADGTAPTQTQDRRGLPRHGQRGPVAA